MNTKAKLLLGIAGMCAITLIGGTTSTLAWFYTNTTVTASGLTMMLEMPTSALQAADIAHSATATSTDWKDTLTLSSSDVLLTPVMPLNTVGSLEFDPCSSATTSRTNGGANISFIQPSASNPTLSNGSLSIDPSKYASSAYKTYFEAAPDTSYFLKEFRLKYKDYDASVSKTLKVRGTMTVATESDFWSSLRFCLDEVDHSANNNRIFAKPVKTAAKTYSLKLDIIDSDGECETDYVKIKGMDTKYTLAAYIEGRDSHCTMGYYQAGSVSIELTFDVVDWVLAEGKN